MKSFINFLVKEEAKPTEASADRHNPISVDAFHGSGVHFDQFKQEHAKLPNDYYGGGIGYFTTSHNVATTYAKSRAASMKTKTPHVYHTNLSMKNVFDVDHVFTGEELKKFLPKDELKHEQFARHAGIMKYGTDRIKTVDDLRSGKASLTGHQLFQALSENGNSTAKARDLLIKHGYDGLRYNGGANMDMAERHDVYIPYHAKHIKIKKVEKI